MTDVNGNPNGTAAHANYTDEAIARLTQATESLAWDDLDLATQEDIMLTAFRPAEWLSRKGVIVGAVKKADDDEAWYHWKALARERGVDAYGYEKAVDAFLARAQRAGVPTSPETGAVPSPAPLDASLVTSGDLLNLTLPPKTPYLDWLSERSLAMVYGPRGVGKTLWLLELGISLSQLFHWTQDRVVDLGAPDWGAFGRTARKETPEALSGFHARHLLYVVDESSGVPEEIFEAAEGALSTPDARVLLLGNPLRNAGTFAASHRQKRGEYTALHFRSQDSPLVDPGYRDRLVRKWGEGSNIVRVRADGDFPRQEDDVLISLDLTEPCLRRERIAGSGPRILGVDVARYGDDRTVLLVRQGRLVEHIKVYAKQDTMQTVGRVVSVLAPWQVDVVAVDRIGIGAGVYDRLAELRKQGRITCHVHGVEVSQAAPPKKTADEMQAYRLRDHLWLLTAAWLRDESPVFAAADRAACEDLAGELASVGYSLNSNGELVVESKDEMKKRLGHSPDIADSLCCAFAPGIALVRKASVIEIHV
jgi:phage terminase large subunit